MRPPQCPSRSSRHPAVLGSLAIAFSLATANAMGDVVSAFYLNSGLYSYKVLHMPDVDQRRSVLPSDGSMYCVPTATFNIFAYAANHGFPGAPPEDGNWALQSKYIEASLWLNLLGDWMNTDPDDGTEGAGTVAGLDAMLQMAPYLKRVHKWLSHSYVPTTAKLALYGCNGWAMSFCYGKWAAVDTHNGLPVLDRVGGHAITLTRAYRDADQWLLRYRDPADESASLTTQSAFVNTVRHPYKLTAYYGGTSIYNLRSMDALFATSGGTRVIDTLFGIRPMFGLSFQSSGDSLAGGSVQVLDPIGFEGSVSAMQPSVQIPSTLEVLDFGFDGDFQNALVIATSSIIVTPSRLRTLDLSTGALTILTPAPSNLERFAADRFGRIHAFDSSNTLHRLESDGTPIGDTTAIPTPSDVAFHGGDDSVWVLSVPQRKVVKLFYDYSETLLMLTVPGTVPMSGEGRLAIHPISGEAWFMTDADDTLYGLFVPAAGGVGVRVFNSPALEGAESFSFGDAGELFVTGDGSVRVLAPVGTTSWTIDEAHPFHGLPGGSHLAMLRNSDNYDPIEHDGPQWRNLTNAELEVYGPFTDDCQADFDANEVVDGNDLGTLLGEWGQGVVSPADLDGDGNVDGSDLGDLLGAWGPCL